MYMYLHVVKLFTCASLSSVSSTWFEGAWGRGGDTLFAPLSAGLVAWADVVDASCSWCDEESWVVEELCCLRPATSVSRPPLNKNLVPGSSGGPLPSPFRVAARLLFRERDPRPEEKEEVVDEEADEEADESEVCLLSTLRDRRRSSRSILFLGPKRPLFCWVLLKRSISLPTEEMVSASTEFGDLTGSTLLGGPGSCG